MADASAYAENIKKYANGGYNQAAAEKIYIAAVSNRRQRRDPQEGLPATNKTTIIVSLDHM